MRAKDDLSTKVLNAKPETPVREIAALVRGQRTNAVPVLEDGGLVNKPGVLRRQEVGAERGEDGWADVRTWRRAKRNELIAKRLNTSRAERARIASIVGQLIRAHVQDLDGGCIGLYWPFKGELDFREFAGGCIEKGAEAALPVVVEKGKPLEFWSWRPGALRGRGIWDIPIPAERATVHPTALLVPLVGFDVAGYRLGYGGGYYDRTLAVMTPRPLTIGVGQESGRLETIHPQPHDIPMDAIVTDAGFAWVGRPPAQLGRAAQAGEKQ